MPSGGSTLRMGGGRPAKTTTGVTPWAWSRASMVCMRLVGVPGPVVAAAAGAVVTGVAGTPASATSKASPASAPGHAGSLIWLAWSCRDRLSSAGQSSGETSTASSPSPLRPVCGASARRTNVQYSRVSSLPPAEMASSAVYRPTSNSSKSTAASLRVWPGLMGMIRWSRTAPAASRTVSTVPASALSTPSSRIRSRGGVPGPKTLPSASVLNSIRGRR